MYHGQFLLDQYLHEHFFVNKQNGFFVECGATDGLLETTCKFFEDSLNWTGINIEASPPLYSKLINNRPNCLNLNIGLSDHNKILEFSHAIHPSMGELFGNGSFTHHKSHISDLVNQGCVFKKYNVECNMFSNIFNNSLNDFYKKINLFVLDVEGHELQALSGIINISNDVLPDVFCIEYSFSGLDNISKLLKGKYIQHSIHHHNVIFTKL
ncbi:MAG: FkbM family methyltransferase [Clostridia bacterium]|jgi:FkbM family methyltransferase